MPPASDPSWEVSLARLEGKLDAIITSTAALTSTVTDLDRDRKSTRLNSSHRL